MKLFEKPAKISRQYVVRLSIFFVVATLAVAYLTYSPRVNSKFYNVRVLFKPVKCAEYTQEWQGRKAQEVQFKNKAGTSLYGLYFPGPSAKRTILVHHGQYGNLNNHLQYFSILMQPENSVFFYDYSGFGKSEGSPTIRGMMEDARAAYGFLTKNLNVDAKRIVQFGGSLGSGPAAQLAMEQPCAGLILFSPYTSIKTAARDFFPFLHIYPDFLLTENDFDTLANVRRLKVPVLIGHGANDPTIGVRHSDEIYAAAHEPKTYVRVNQLGHIVSDSDEVQKKVAQFVCDLG